MFCISTVQKRFKLSNTHKNENSEYFPSIKIHVKNSLFQKIFAVLLLSIPVLILAFPQRQRIDPRNSQTATIIQHENNNIGVGNYHFA